MKTKQFIISALVLSTILVEGGQVFAEPGPIPANSDSNAEVKFVPDDEITPPVEPPVGPWTPGTPGPLSIDFASNLSFGENKITSVDKVYNAEPQAMEDGSTKGNWVQVTDNRGGEKGWNLKVAQNGQFISQTGKELKGAEIEFKNGVVENTWSNSVLPSTSAPTFKLVTDGAVQDVFSAAAGEGAGTWVYRFGDDKTKGESITLAVPGKSTKYTESYSTTLTWTLTDIPGNIGKENLVAKIVEASKLVESEYTKESWAPFKTELEAAKKISDDPLATQAQIDAELEKLTEVMNALEKI
ncbi:MAG: WxL domain-containing protein [Carnobacterium sp.]|uniref:WxL domain-containing protein n=1 Tax=Carnobacterium sp. TaxID=48221 RepID=UPI002FCC1B65